MKMLNELYENEAIVPIEGIKTDSREIKKGDLFVAIRGFHVNHSDYIEDAIKNGASAVVSDSDCKFSVPCIQVEDINQELTKLCQEYYNYHNELNLIGITGTDGKTTTATIIYQLLNHFVKTAYLGTNGITFEKKNMKTENTTPKKENLYEYFSTLKDKGCKTVSMEVSSEALLHGRVDSFLFRYAIFTNITEDHLNIHETVDSYINSKLKLLDYLEEDGIVILNSDDEILKNINTSRYTVYTYGQNSECDFQICDIKLEEKSSIFTIKHNDKKYKIESPYPFLYNIYNLTAAFIVCFLEKINTKKAIKYIKKLQPILGRGEMLSFGQDYHIILDYAHTENGIKNLVENVKKYKNKIIVVTGSAGGRETQKRKRIGSYLLNNVDFVIFTMDDPRNESVSDIINQMIGNEKNTNYIRIENRERAIFYAFDIAEKGDYVLVIGKGRDTYMAIGNEKLDYSDYEVICKYFE